jgi:hypothetical protein
MKTLVLGDTHGRPYWKEIVAKENPDRVVFIGDYFDSYDDYTAAEQMDNFKKIVEYKQLSERVGDEVIMLVGNHDYHYMRGVSEHYSGYQGGAAPAIQQLLEDNKEHLQMCYKLDDFLFSHAGISHDWLTIHGYSVEHDVVEWVNDKFKFTPKVFEFAGWEPHGDSVISPPIWIRPLSLLKSNKDTWLKEKHIQVVGHTQVNKIDVAGKATGGKYYLIDTLGTTGEYMMIEDDKITFPVYKKEE